MGKGSGIVVSSDIGHRCGSDPVWLWLGATALIRSLAWELLYAPGAALKKTKKKKKKKIILGEAEAWLTSFPESCGEVEGYLSKGRCSGQHAKHHLQ